MTAPIPGDWPSIVFHANNRSETSVLSFLELQATAKADPEQTSQFLANNVSFCKTDEEDL